MTNQDTYHLVQGKNHSQYNMDMQYIRCFHIKLFIPLFQRFMELDKLHIDFRTKIICHVGRTYLSYEPVEIQICKLSDATLLLQFEDVLLIY